MSDPLLPLLATTGWARWLQPRAAVPGDLVEHLSAHEQRLIAALGRRPATLAAARSEQARDASPAATAQPPTCPIAVLHGRQGEDAAALAAATLTAELHAVDCATRPHLAQPKLLAGAVAAILAH